MGIYVDANGLTAALCDVEKPHRTHWRQHQAVKDMSDAESLLRFFEQIHRQVGRRYIPVSIVLADPWVHQLMLEFETLPKKSTECDTLIRWRLARDWQRDDEHYAISWQYLGERESRQWIVAQSIEREQLDPLVQAARNHGLMLSGVDTASNLLLKHMKYQANSILLNLQTDHWSLSLTGERGWPVYRRATWQTAPHAGQYEGFAAQLERMVVAVRPEKIEQLVLVPGVEPEPELYEVLSKRLGQQPQILALPGDKTSPQTAQEQLAIQALGNLCH